MVRYLRLKLNVWGFTLFGILVASACAKQGTPSGGEKDEIPPAVVEENPTNFSTNLRPKKIALSFDEYIVLANPDKDWIISPPLKYTPEVKLRSKTLEILIKDTLKDQTTYTLDFGASIKDLHEGNVLENYKYVFSTGSYLDSGKVGGNTRIAQEDETIEKISVGLYEVTPDTFVLGAAPLYLGKSNEAGFFELPFLRKDTFQLYAWEDKNANRKWDLNERVDFSKEFIIPRSDSVLQDTLNLRLFQQPYDTLKVTKFKLIDNYKVLLTYNKAVSKEKLEIKVDDVAFINSFGDSTVIWFNEAQQKDSVTLYLEEKTLTDTLVFYPNGIEKRERDSTVTYKITTPVKPKDSLWMCFSEPLAQDSFPLNYTTALDSTPKIAMGYRSTQNATAFYATFPTEYGTVVKIKSGINASGIYRSHLDSIKSNFNIATKEGFGRFILNLKDAQSGYILFGKKEQLKRYQPDGNLLTIPDLSPGNYLLYFVEDRDNNKAFTPGNIYEKIPAEKVSKFQSKIEIRANWDYDLDWVLSAE